MSLQTASKACVPAFLREWMPWLPVRLAQGARGTRAERQKWVRLSCPSENQETEEMEHTQAIVQSGLVWGLKEQRWQARSQAGTAGCQEIADPAVLVWVLLGLWDASLALGCTQLWQHHRSGAQKEEGEEVRIDYSRTVLLTGNDAHQEDSGCRLFPAPCTQVSTKAKITAPHLSLSSQVLGSETRH